MDAAFGAYCPTCSSTIAGQTSYRERAEGMGADHAAITGHPVQLVDFRLWKVIYTIPAQPHIPFGDRP